MFVILLHTYFAANNSQCILDADDCQCEVCYDEIELLKKTIAENERKLKEAKEQYRLALIDNLRCDIALEEITQKRIKNRYIGFANDFPIETIQEFRALENAEDDDYKFVLAAIRGLHKGNLESLRLKSMNGQMVNECDLIAPAKMQIIESAFTQRLKYINEVEMVDDARKKLVEEHINRALIKINNNWKDKSDTMNEKR